MSLTSNRAINNEINQMFEDAVEVDHLTEEELDLIDKLLDGTGLDREVEEAGE